MDDYKIIRVKANEQVKSSHHLFYKQHSTTKSSELNSRVLFVSNVPPYLNEQCIKSIFGPFGKIEQIKFFIQPKSNPFTLDTANSNKFLGDEEEDDEMSVESDKSKFSFKFAYVLFEQVESVERAVSKSVEKERVLGKDCPISTGMKKWVDEYKARFIDVKKVKKDIDEFLKEYDEKKTLKEKEEEEAGNQPDDDGFITVTPKNKKANLRFTERNVEKLKSKLKKKRQQMQLVNFYSFQMKESKKEYIAQLRMKFDEDKKRIESMKQGRKFKPF